MGRWRSKEVWGDVKVRSRDFDIKEAGQDATDTISQRWSQFYGLVKEVVQEGCADVVALLKEYEEVNNLMQSKYLSYNQC